MGMMHWADCQKSKRTDRYRQRMDLNIGSENKRFIYGNVHKKDIYNTKVEGKEPDEIIYFEICDKPFYFWYYENFQSDKAGNSLTIEIQK